MPIKEDIFLICSVEFRLNPACTLKKRKNEKLKISKLNEGQRL